MKASQAIGPAAADLSHVDAWIFDLDNTLYPAGSEIQGLMDVRITGYVSRVTGLSAEAAHTLQKRYLHEHGTTLAGLMAHHGVEPHAFLEEVHDFSLDCLSPDPDLARALARLPGRRLVFTNASARHAERVLARLGLSHLFDEVFHLEAADMTPKPQAGAYRTLITAHSVRPRTSVFFEDSERNLAPAAELGMTTVLVGAHARDSTASFVHFRTENLAGFLQTARVRMPLQVPSKGRRH